MMLNITMPIVNRCAFIRLPLRLLWYVSNEQQDSAQFVYVYLLDICCACLQFSEITQKRT